VNAKQLSNEVRKQNSPLVQHGLLEQFECSSSYGQVKKFSEETLFPK
jgi:hypothetical protein